MQRVTSPKPSQCFGLSRPLKPLDKGTCLSAAASDRAYYSTCSQQDVRPDQTQRAPRSAGRGKQWFALLVSECVAVAVWWNRDTLTNRVQSLKSTTANELLAPLEQRIARLREEAPLTLRRSAIILPGWLRQI